MKPEDEYATLREEILHWQTRRFNVLTAVLIVIPATLGWIVSNPDKLSWPVASIFPLLFQACACHLTWLFSFNGIVIGTYLETRCNSQWEKSRRLIDAKYPMPHLNTSLSLLYLVLAAFSVGVPAMLCEKPPTFGSVVFFAIALLTFIVLLLRMALKSYQRDLMIERWKNVDTELQKK